MNDSLVVNNNVLDSLFNNKHMKKDTVNENDHVTNGNGTNKDAFDNLLDDILGPEKSSNNNVHNNIFEQQKEHIKIPSIFVNSNKYNENDMVSETSPMNDDMMEKTPEMPIENSQILYHIILDSDFGMRHKLHEHDVPVFGKLRNVKSNKVPVLFDLQEARNVALRLIDQTIKMGTIGNKQYPVFGAIILGIHLNNIIASDISVNTGSGARDYKSVMQSNSNLIVYDINGTKRGMLKKSELARAQIVNASYVKKLNTSETIGFYLHNINPKLTSDDVKLLKQLYDANGEQVTYISQLGGNNSADYKAYIHAKRSYLKLKNMVSNSQTGGTINNDQSRYLELKAIATQKGMLLVA